MIMIQEVDGMKKFFLMMLLVVAVFASGCTQRTERVLEEADVYTFSDGEKVSVFRLQSPSSKRYYQLSDGTELLMPQIHLPIFDKDAPFQELDECVRQRILDFYQQQGAVCDIADLLEQAYAAYKADPADFSGLMLTQDTYLRIIDDQRVLCDTRGFYSTAGSDRTDYSVLQNFDKTTGEPIE